MRSVIATKEGEKKPLPDKRILVVLQNAYTNSEDKKIEVLYLRKEEMKEYVKKNPPYEDPKLYVLRLLYYNYVALLDNTKTGINLWRMLGDHALWNEFKGFPNCDEAMDHPIRFINSTPIWGYKSSSKEKYDLEYLKRMIELFDPYLVIGCGDVAKEAVSQVWENKPTLFTCHPAARFVEEKSSWFEDVQSQIFDSKNQVIIKDIIHVKYRNRQASEITTQKIRDNLFESLRSQVESRESSYSQEGRYERRKA